MAKKVPCTNEDKPPKAFINSMRAAFMPVSRRNMTASRKNLWIRRCFGTRSTGNKLFDGPIDADFGWWQPENGSDDSKSLPFPR